VTYCSVQQVRLLSGLDSSDITDEDIRELRDRVATAEMNEDINQTVEAERIDREISDEKQNDIDGENTEFYLREVHRNDLFVGDSNNDGVVDREDLDVYFIDQDDNRVDDLQIELRDIDTGEFELTRADGSALDTPNVTKIFANYKISPVNQDGFGEDFSSEGPDRLIETACAQLTASYSFTNIEASKLKDFSIGDVSINTQSEGASIMRQRYMETLRRITQKEVIQSGENTNTTDNVFANGVR